MKTIRLFNLKKKTCFIWKANGGGDEEEEPAKNAGDVAEEAEEAEEPEETEEVAEKPEETKPATDNNDVKETSEDNENDQEHLQLTVAESDKLDTSNVDNEDSLNLTIGEDEAKIFQDEVCTRTKWKKKTRLFNFPFETCIKPKRKTKLNNLFGSLQETEEKVKENNSK